jgi:Zn-dependent protease with chaperone function
VTGKGMLPLVLATVVVIAGIAVGTSPSSSAPAAKAVDAAHVQRLQRVMIPLIKGMNHPLALDKVRIGVADDDQINAASAGSSQFIVTRGLLEKANDNQLRGVLAHELAHEDLGHVAKTQRLGTGVNIGIALLEQIFPGSSAITPLAGKLIVNRYTQNEEYAADRHGADILQRAGYSRALMADTLTWLLRVEGGASGGFFATHPATDERIQALNRAH